MKQFYLVLLSASLLWSGQAQAQISRDSVTFSNAVGLQRIFNPNVNIASTCASTASVNIPSGNWIYGVDLYYTMQGQAGFFGISPSQIGTYLQCNTQGVGEAQITYGNSTTAGAIESTSRLNLNFANGPVTLNASQIDFELHGFVNTFFGTNCDSNTAKIVAGTWKIVLHHGPAPSCFQAQNAALDYRMHDRAALSWTSGGASNWQIEYGAPGFPLGSGTRVNAGSNPFVLGGLSPSTDYEFYVRDSCGPGDVGQWSLPASFRTLCAPVTFATSYSENFDGAGWTAGTGVLNANNGIANCWERNPEAPLGFATNRYAWGTGSGATGTANTGPSADRSGTGNYLYTEGSGGANQDVALISSPLIDLSSLSAPAVSFYYHRFGADVGGLKLQVWNQSMGWQDVWTQSGPQNQNASADPWIEEIVALPAYVNDTIRLRFRGVRSFGAAGDMAIDEVELREAPNCPDPLNFALSARGTNQLQLSWTSSNASTWRIEYGAPGFNLGSGTQVTASSNPFLLSGLSPGTDYEIYLRSICGSDSSRWVGPLRTATYCAPVAAPYSENFDGSNWLAGTGVYNAGDSLAPCWSRNPGRGSSAVFPVFWGLRSLPPSTPNTGPSADFSGTGNYAYLESSAGSLGQRAELETGFIDLSSLNVPELRFYYHMFGDAMGSLAVEVYSPSQGSSSLWSLSGQQQSARTDAWLEAIVDLSAYSGDTIALRFVGIKGNERRGDLAIDEISIDERPLCPEPQNLVASNPSANSIDLSWTTGGSAHWQLEYGPPGFTPGTGTIVNLNSNPYTLSGLTAAQNYDLYLRDSCGLGDVSLWTGPVNFSTACGLVLAPWRENFDQNPWQSGTGGINNGNVISACWSRPSPANPNFGTRTGATGSFATGPTGDFSGSGNYLYTEASGAQGSGEITTPQVVISSSLTAPALSFYYHAFGQNIDSLWVEVDPGTGFVPLWSLVGQAQNASADPWTLAQISLSAYSGDTLRFRFSASNGGFNGDVAIDEVAVENIACPQPSALALGTIGASTVSLSWSSSGSQWQIEYGPTGFSQGNGSIVNLSSNPHTIGGLNPASTYDFYLRDSCGPGNVSAWIGPVTATTLCSVFNVPFQENFDDSTWAIGVGAQNAGNLINACWTRPTANPPHFGTGSGATPSANTGPNGDFSGSGNYLYTEFSGAGAANFGEIISPLIYLDPVLSNPELQFAYHLYGGGIDSLASEVLVNGIPSALGAIVGPQQNASGDPWLQASYDLSAFSGDTIQIRLRGYAANFLGDIAVDEFAVVNQTCPQPSNLALTSATKNSVSLSWTSGGASHWQIEYGPVGFNLGSGSLVNAGSNPFTVSGLNASSNYHFYLRDSCGPGDLSFWIGPLTGATLCDTVIAPYFENFDVGFDPGLSPQAGNAPHNIGATISPCWNRDSDSAYFWGGGSGATVSFATGPNGDHTTGNGNYVFVEASFAPLTSEAWLETPVINLDSLAFPEMRFWLHMWAFNGAMGDLIWEIDSGNGYHALDSLSGNQGNLWQEIVTDLRDYGSTNVQIRFRARRGQGANPERGDLAIDDLSIIEGPACPDPDSLILVNRDAQSLSIDWQANVASTGQVRYREIGTSTFSWAAVPSKPHTISGLQANTSYEVCVRDSCGPGQVSQWICAVFSTDCAPFSMPFAENFDGSNWVPGAGALNAGNQIDNCWRRPSDAVPNFGPGTGATASAATGPSADFSGSGNYLYTEYSAAGGALFGEISSPLILIDASAANPELSFAYHLFGNQIDSLSVSVEKQSQSSHLWSLSGAQQSASTDAWQQAFADLSAFSGDTIRLVFRAYGSGFNADMAIDEILLRDAPCPAPSNFSISGQSTTSITLSWLSSNSQSQIEYGPLGFSPGSGTRVNASSNPFSITGLQPGTPYALYLRDSCSATDTTLWLGPINGNTDCPTSFSTPYLENFDFGFEPGAGATNAGGSISPCWTRNDSLPFFWGGGSGATPSGGTGPQGDHTSGTGSYVYAEASGGAAGDTAILESPTIDLSNLNNPELRFWLHHFSQGNGQGSLSWEIFSNGSYSPLGSTSTSVNAWTEFSEDLSAYANQSIRIRFTAVRGGSFQYDPAIDDFSIDEKVLCPPLNLPYAEDFDGSAWQSGTGATNLGNQIDGCWERSAGGISWGTGTGATPSAATGPAQDLSGTGNYLYTEASLGNGSAWIQSPLIYLDSSLSNLHLWYHYHLFGASTDSLVVQAGNEGNWTTLRSFVGAQQNSAADPWRLDSVDLSAFSGDTLRIRFRGAASNFTGDIAIDGLRIEEAALPCQSLTNLSFSNISATEVEISWNAVNGPGLATISYYETAVGPATSASVSGLSSPYTLSGLIPNTRYTIIVEDSCSASQVSPAVSDTVSTAPCATPTNLSFSNIGINSVDISWSTNLPGASVISYYDISLGLPAAVALPGLSSPYTLGGLQPNTTYVIAVYDSCGPGVYGNTRSDTVTTLPCPAVTAQFSSTVNILAVNFNSSASVNADSLDWDFGDGNSQQGANPSHSYAAAGLYSVQLIARSTCGASDTIVQSLRVCDTLEARFEDSVSVDLLSFDAAGSRGASRYRWDFGDGGSDSVRSGQYQYNSTGNYTITLWVYNLCGDSTSTSVTRQVCAAPQAGWSYTVLPPTGSGLRIQFDASASQNAVSYDWDFGDGNSGTGVNPIHIYATPGLFYEVTLTVRNACGDKSIRKLRLSQVSLEEWETAAAYRLYPNPAQTSSLLAWDLPRQAPQALRLIDISGRSLRQYPVPPLDGSLQYRIDLQGLAPGAYWLELERGARKIHLRLLVE